MVVWVESGGSWHALVQETLHVRLQEGQHELPLLRGSLLSSARSGSCSSKLRSDLIGTLLSIGAGKQFLTAAQGEGIRRAQSCLQTLALGVTQGTREDRFSHTMEDKLLPIILLGYALGRAMLHTSPGREEC
jgi:hypothetical protein